MLHSLQILRGLAAWAVVFHHLHQSLKTVDPVIREWLAFFGKYGSLGVDVFFVLSGFVMAMVAPKYASRGIDFALNRFFRVIPIYWFYTFLLLLSLMLLPDYSYITAFTPNSFIKSLLLIPHDHPVLRGRVPFLYVGWTLTYELFFYAIFAACIAIFRRWYRVGCAFSLIAIALLTINHRYLGASSLLLLEFAAGMCVFAMWTRMQEKLPFMGLAGLLLALSAFSFNLPTFASNSMFGVGVVLLFLGMENAFRAISVGFLVKLGDYSYSTYLSHVIIIGWFVPVVRAGISDWEKIAVIFIVCLFVYLISAATYHAIEINQKILDIKLTVSRLILRTRAT